jgi:hypothetical protein
MNWKDWVMRFGVSAFIEGPGQRRSFDAFQTQFSQTGSRIQERIRNARDANAEKTIRHIIGMERWGQHRLKTALGEPLVVDEHHPYKPEKGLGTQALLEAFQATRQDTLALVRQLERSGFQGRILHNGLGPLTVKGWLQYLNAHADLESRRLRSGKLERMGSMPS